MSSSPDQKPDLTEVLEHYGATHVPQRFGWAAMLCPFHGDRTKSASVNTEAGEFRCFTCEVAGDSYALIMQQEGLGFRDAVEFGKRFTGGSDSAVRTVRDRGQYVPGAKGHRPGARKYTPPGRRKRPGSRA